jgi:GTP cyclohydrolase I
MTKAIEPKPDREARIEIIENAVATILEAMNEELREGLEHTPRRVAEMLIDEFCRDGDPLERELSTMFVEEKIVREQIIVKDIPFYSLCEHHMIPYFGKAHIGYIPKTSIVGISKLVRLVQAAGKGFTIQERVTERIADALEFKLQPIGIVVVLEAVHTCMIVRGVKAIGSSTTTSALRGLYRDSEGARAEFFSLVTQGGANGLGCIL